MLCFDIFDSKFCRQIGLALLTFMKTVFIQLQTTRHTFEFGESQN